MHDLLNGGGRGNLAWERRPATRAAGALMRHGCEHHHRHRRRQGGGGRHPGRGGSRRLPGRLDAAARVAPRAGFDGRAGAHARARAGLRHRDRGRGHHRRRARDAREPDRVRRRQAALSDMHDLAIITVSTNEAHYIRPCLRTVFEHVGDASVDVVVVDNDSHDGTADMVAAEFPAARTVWSRNHGFGHANNRGLMTCNARYVLFLNPDTEILEGTFGDLVRMMDSRPEVGLIGARQINGAGQLGKTIRRAPNALRALGDAFALERLPGRPRWLGERELDPAAYEREFDCDWTSGSF